MSEKTKKDDLFQYRTFGLTLLQLMAVLAVVGLVVTLALHFFL